MITRKAAFIARVVIVLALIAFTGVMVVFGHPYWGALGFIMAVNASLSSVKSDEPDPSKIEII